MKKILLLFTALLCSTLSAQEKQTITGTISSSGDNTPLAGVNVIIKGSTMGTSTDAEGKFVIQGLENQTMVISFIGYKQKEIPLHGQTKFEIKLEEDISTLGEVTIVSTGYQQIPKERVTGSFAFVDNQLINRRVSTSILSRLEDVTSGLIFNRNIAGQKNDISIRGISTINSQAQPLIIIDNFPYDGDINNINPNDVENITVLKDAAAASIWGARAGNGVIVITTKKGSSNQPMKVSFNSNVTVTQKPDLFYQPRMTSGQLIETEQRLFEKGFYAVAEASPSSPLTPAVELMIANRDGLISDSELQNQLAVLGSHEVRSDYEKYLYRKSVNQQYAVNLNGGTATHRYFLSAGVDKNLDNLVGNQFNRITLNFNNSWTVLKDKLTVNAGVYYSNNRTTTDNGGTSSILYNDVYPLYAYAKLKDDNGNNIPVTKDHRLAFIDEAEQAGLLNWHYSPLDEINETNNTSKLVDLRINTSLHYKIIDGLHAEVLYQYWRGNTERKILRSENSYYARNLINRFSVADGSGSIMRPIPLGGILDVINSNSENQSVRGQMKYAKNVYDHDISALAGYEVRELNTIGSSSRNYGYSNELATIRPVNYTGYFPRYDSPYSGGVIPFVDGQSSLTDRFVSYYANASYTYKRRYTISGSARRDQSNLFGVKANQRSVPLWSSGLGWTISEESFFKSSLLPYLKVRTTYGSNGNVNKQTTAYTTARSLGYDDFTGLPYNVIMNPGNPDLRWEKVNIYNAGLDFEMQNRRVFGSLEFFIKSGKDLIGTVPFSPSSGVTTFTGNFASTKSHGVDIILNSLNIDRSIKWNTSLLFSTIKEKVTNYKSETLNYYLLQYGPGEAGLVAPQEGKPLYALYSYEWAGLNPENGNPQGLLDGVASTDYSAIVSTTTAQKLIYNGPARPTAFGSLRNTLSWKNLSFSFNISYRLGYYFRKKSVLYGEVLAGHASHSDYTLRWEKQGDELNTNVPSLPDNYDVNRESVYTYSDILVAKGDHIRLQDITLSYSLDRKTFEKLPFLRVEIYSYMNNIGILWKAASGNADPDYTSLKPQRSIALGLRLDF